LQIVFSQQSWVANCGVQQRARGFCTAWGRKSTRKLSNIGD